MLLWTKMRLLFFLSTWALQDSETLSKYYYFHGNLAICTSSIGTYSPCSRIHLETGCITKGFPGGSDSKESAWNTGDPGLIPGWVRSAGEGNGNPLQYSCLENPVTEKPGGCSPQARKESDMAERLTLYYQGSGLETIFEKVMHSLTFDQMTLRN